jgi:hypothetical protein
MDDNRRVAGDTEMISELGETTRQHLIKASNLHLQKDFSLKRMRK